ncbi:unnamed protein product [Alternaria burnsii]|nr:unnamed protein product [Alternaria burnsii]
MSYMSVAMRPWISVESWGPDRIDVIGIGTDNQMYRKSFDRSDRGWKPAVTSWEPLGGKFKQVPAAISWGFGRLDIFGIGLDNQPYHKAWGKNRKAGDFWIISDWQGITGGLVSAPVPVSWGNGRIDIFGIGGTGHTMYRRTYGEDWTPGAWEKLPGKFKSLPSAVSWGPGRLDVFAIGMDDQMYHRAYDGGKWLSSWNGMSGKFKSCPFSVSWGSGRLDVFGIGLDDQMYHKAYDGKDWVSKDWKGISGKFKSTPSAVSWESGRIDVFGIELDDQMYHKAFDNGN